MDVIGINRCFYAFCQDEDKISYKPKSCQRFSSILMPPLVVIIKWGLYPNQKACENNFVTPATAPKNPLICPVNQLPELQLHMNTKTSSALWNKYIQRYHSLGHSPLSGGQLRYFIMAG